MLTTEETPMKRRSLLAFSIASSAVATVLRRTARAEAASTVSIGPQKGPPIGVE
jgi:hypothetical protein